MHLIQNEIRHCDAGTDDHTAGGLFWSTFQLGPADDFTAVVYWSSLATRKRPACTNDGQTIIPGIYQPQRVHAKESREKYYPTERFGPNKRIVVNLGMPRTGTNSWISMMKGLYYNSGEFHRIFDKYEPHDLAELLLLGNRSSPSNPLHRTLVEPPANGDIRAVSDHLLLTGVHRQGFPSRLLGPGDERDRSARQ